MDQWKLANVRFFVESRRLFVMGPWDSSER